MSDTRLLSNPETQLANLAARLVGLAIQTAQAGSDPREVANAAELHNREKLYPRLVITSPHGGGAVRLELTMHDPDTDEEVVRMIQVEASAEGSACH